jgi:hypothetical protein
MSAKLPDDQTLWFRNLPLKESEEVSDEVQESAEKSPEVELFIEPRTGLAIPMPNQEKKRGQVTPLNDVFDA